MLTFLLLFGAGLLARLQRLGWYAAFHEVEDYPAAGTYFRFFAQDRQRLAPCCSTLSGACPTR